MAKIKLKSALSYVYGKYTFKAGKVKNVPDAVAEYLVGAGHCVYVDSETRPAEQEEGLGTVVAGGEHPETGENAGEDLAEQAEGGKSVKKMNKTELIEYAEAKGYDISECIRVEEIRSKILELDEFVAEVNEE